MEATRSFHDDVNVVRSQNVSYLGKLRLVSQQVV